MIVAWLQALFGRSNQAIELLHTVLTRLRDDRERQQTILHMIRQIGNTMATQADLDALSARLSAVADSFTAGVANIRSDIADLKAANPGVDTSALEATVARLEANAADVTELDSENPAPPVP